MIGGSGWNQALFEEMFRKKYDQSQQALDIDKTKAQAAQTSAGADVMSAEGSRTANMAQAERTRAEVPFVGGLMKAQTQAQLGSASQGFAESAFTRSKRKAFDMPLSSFQFRKGIAKVPGKGDGKVDTQPAMLAPGEAVLNKAAAGMLGRKKITQLNKKGVKKMGMV